MQALGATHRFNILTLLTVPPDPVIRTAPDDPNSVRAAEDARWVGRLHEEQ